MEGATRRASGEGEWRSQHIPNRLIGIHSSRLSFPSPKSYVKHVPQSLLVSVRPSALPFERCYRLSISVESDLQLCVWILWLQRKAAGFCELTRARRRCLEVADTIARVLKRRRRRHSSCTNIKCRCDWNAQCSGKPHINTNPQRHITYDFNLTFKQSCIFDCLFHINL